MLLQVLEALLKLPSLSDHRFIRVSILRSAGAQPVDLLTGRNVLTGWWQVLRLDVQLADDFRAERISLCDPRFQPGQNTLVLWNDLRELPTHLLQRASWYVMFRLANG